MFVLRELIKVTYVPLMLGGFLAAALYALAGGYGYGALLVLLLLAIGISFALERLVPYERQWNQDRGDSWRDVLHAFVNEGANASSVALLPLIVAIVPGFDIWPTDWPMWGQLFLAILIADCGITLVHYASHIHPTLWRFHAVHHSVKRMYGFNGLMKHPLHQAIETLGGTCPLILMGIPLDIAALLAFAVAIQLLLQHSNVDVKIGPLRYILALSPLHRFHHIKWPVEGDVNFGLFTTIWDRMLGTAVYDAKRRFSSNDLGIGKEPNYPDTYLAQLIRPFKAPSKTEATVPNQAAE
ncbi:sterol desaturase family protein [Kordiimonas lacus]|uniref:Sterol desaturase/sphingolipid hydroxylase, fatty acid hydroxylase superfamily n=1 Tax=Kordiimonas lacus TaxID=637679 RepID=A0A1G6WKN2_9PROT|nr:sterol desaturase family protein [Kordiimonas lacus]SDD66398.1 Sterol desaturase/sphingolipid hydroxylase, fatty acid hydroxylase superfamily [Kordiimonas lacus]